MRIKATIVAYAFLVQCFEHATIVAYAGLRVKYTNDFNRGSSSDALFINMRISFSWYLVCKSLAMVSLL